MNPTKIYNEGQEEFELKAINKESGKVFIYYEFDGETKTHCVTDKIGIYEFLGNPKYKAIETLFSDPEVVREFWEWMESKGYYKDFAEWYEYDEKRTEYIPKQMLYGYKVNFLKEQWGGVV